MSPDQVVSMFLMAFIGLAGLVMAFEGNAIVRKIGWLWMAAWWLPPLLAVWTKGVFG